MSILDSKFDFEISGPETGSYVCSVCQSSYTNKGNFKQHVEKHFKNGEFQANGPEMVNGKTNGYGKKIIYFDNSQIPFKFHKHSFLLIN